MTPWRDTSKCTLLRAESLTIERTALEQQLDLDLTYHTDPRRSRLQKRLAIYFQQVKNKPEVRKPSKIEMHSGSIHFKLFVTHFYLLPSFSLRAPIPDTKPSSPALLMKKMQVSCHTQVTMSISASI